MHTRTLTADAIRVGMYLNVNGKWTRVSAFERMQDGRIRLGYRGMGVICLATTTMTAGFPNARFWVYYGHSCVKLTLRPGQTVGWHDSWLHEEGWSSESQQFEYDVDEFVVRRTIDTDGVDCDGRLSRHDSSYCALNETASVPLLDDSLRELPEKRPEWREVSRSQRDYAAEAMGY